MPHTLLLHRRNVPFLADHLGPMLAIPPVPDAATLARHPTLPRTDEADPYRAAVIDALLGIELAQMGRVEAIHLHGLHEPTTWEASVVARLSERLRAPVLATHPAPHGPYSDLAARMQDPLAAWPTTPPQGIQTCEADDIDLEALGGARWLRSAVNELAEDDRAAFLDDVLILVPDDVARVDVWSDRLAEAGIPAQRRTHRGVVEGSVGSWYLTLARLIDAGKAKLEREHLHALFDAPLYRMPAEARRPDLRAILRELRRPRMSLDQLRAHTKGWFARKMRAIEPGDEDVEARVEGITQRQEGIEAILDQLAAVLDAGPGEVWRAILDFTGGDQLAISARLRAAGAADLAHDDAKIRPVLQELRDAEVAAAPSVYAVLHDAIGGQGASMAVRLDHGVRLERWSSWDGRGAGVVMLAGMEDGGFPRPPAPLAADDAVVWSSLGLTEAGQKPAATELQRQTRVLARAVASASRALWISWSASDASGSTTFPGAPLAGRPGPRGEGGPAWDAVHTHLAERDLLPDASSPTAWTPAELRMLPADPVTPDLAAQEARAAHHQQLTAARRPRAEATAIGPYTGRLEAPVPGEAWSAGALEDLGQCGTKFFLQRVLRAERDEDASAYLDALETGTLVHDAFANAALAAIARDGVWELDACDADGTPEAEAPVRRELSEQEKHTCNDHPTLGTGVVHWTTQRWQGAAKAAFAVEAKQRASFFGRDDLDPMTMSEEHLRLLADVSRVGEKKSRKGLINNLISAREVYAERLAEAKAIDSQSFTAKSAKEAAVESQSQLLSTGPLKLSKQKAKDSTGRASGEPGSLTALITEKMNALLTKTQLLITAQVEADESHVPRHVYAAEWAFGLARFPGDTSPSDPRSDHTRGPLTLDFGEGLTLAVKGRVDRIDGDPATGRLTIVDYKTGKKRSEGKLSAQFAQGRHLQLPLYGRAAASLLAPQLDAFTDAPRTVAGRLQFPRSATESSLPLTGPRWQLEGTEGAEPLTADEVLDLHLAHSATRLRSGTLPLAPRACPLRRDADAWCPFEASCGFDPEAEPLLDDAPQPSFEERPVEKGPPKPRTVPKLTPPPPMKPSADPPPVAEAKAAQQHAEAKVLDLERDVVVSAGAGSGKTTQLIRRYRAVITEQHSGPDQILAITFTRKATAELRSRVRDALRAAARSRPDQRDALRAHLLALGTAPILTLDAFAQRVVTALDPDNASKLQITPDLRPFTETWLDGELVEATVKPEDALHALLDRLPLPAVRKHLLALLTLDASALEEIAGLDEDALIDRWRRGLLAAWPELQDAADVLRDLGPDHFEGVEADKDDHAKYLMPLVEHWPAAHTLIEAHGALGLLAGLSCRPLAPSGAFRQSPDLAAAYAPISRARRAWLTSDRITNALAKRLTDGADDDAPLTPATLQAHLLGEARATLDTIKLAKRWRTKLDKAREAQHRVAYDDLMRRATALLDDAAHDADVRAHFPFEHVFVDELQDTNGAQHELINALCNSLGRTADAAQARPPRRFLVGDVKQSIYRFRGAEVDGFQALLDRADADPNTEVAHLGACWRAHPNLTAALDRLFERILDPRGPQDEPLDPAAVVPWEPLAPRWRDADQAPDPDDGPRVELLGEVHFTEPDAHAPVEDAPHEDPDAPQDDTSSEDDDEHDDVDLSVETVIQRIAALRQAHPTHTIALLTHSWSKAERWGGHLQAAGIPAFVQGGRGLLQDPAITPLLAVLNALEREDSLGMLEVLRGPLVGLSDPGLLAIRHARGVQLPGLEDDWAAPTTERLRLSSLRRGFRLDPGPAADWLQSLSGEPLSEATRTALAADAERAADFSDWWPKIRASFGIVPMHQTLAELIAHTGYRRLLYADASVHADAPSATTLRLRLAALRRFQALVRTLCAEHGSAVSVVRALRRLIEDEADPESGSNPFPGDAVTVTVVHQAKGLAWDHVILPAPGAAKPRSRVSDAAAVRAIIDGSPVMLPVLPKANPSDPFATMRSLSSELVHLATLPAERAENRRLLYVACTRARERLLLNGALPSSPHDVRKLIESLQKASPAHAPSLRVSRSWAEDISLAIGFDIQGEAGDETWALRTDAWQPSRDFAFLEPSEHATEAPTTDDAVVGPHPTASALAPVPAHPIPILTPSSAPKRPAPPPTARLTATASPMQPAPFPARQAGTVLHHALAAYGWKPGTPDDATLRDAITAHLNPHLHADAREPALTAALPWLRELIHRAIHLQPRLTARLQAAAARGDLIHEARIQAPTPGGERLEGFIDLLWRDDDNTWHLLDYKLTEPGTKTSVEERVSHHYAQVAAYADVLGPRLSLASFGLWFVAEGEVVWWGPPG